MYSCELFFKGFRRNVSTQRHTLRLSSRKPRLGSFGIADILLFLLVFSCLFAATPADLFSRFTGSPLSSLFCIYRALETSRTRSRLLRAVIERKCLKRQHVRLEPVRALSGFLSLFYTSVFLFFSSVRLSFSSLLFCVVFRDFLHTDRTERKVKEEIFKEKKRGVVLVCVSYRHVL